MNVKKYKKPEIFDISSPLEQAFGLTPDCKTGYQAQIGCANGPLVGGGAECTNGFGNTDGCDNGPLAGGTGCGNGFLG
jgi:hypothetical protein